MTDTTPGKLYTDFQYPFKDAVFFGIFFLMGVVLMYFGYFTPYSDIGFIIYFPVLVCVGILYCVYFGLIAPPHVSIYNWLLMFFFFPKKEIRPDIPSLLNVGLGFETVSISIYTILDVFLIGAIALAVLLRRKSFVCQKISPNVRRLVFFSYVVILVGLINIFIIPQDTDIMATQQDYTHIIATQQYGIMFLSLFPLIAAVILFKGGMYFINTRKAVERIFFYALVSSLLLVIEYILSRYTAILPPQVVYYSLNYRNAFRSVLQSGDLLVSMILILGIASCLYFFLSRRKVMYGVFCILFILLILLTYNRGSLVAAITMIAILLMIHYRLSIKKTLLAFAIILGIMSFLIDYNSQLSILLENIDFLDAVEYYAETRESGILSLDSIFNRAEAQLRAIDVFLNYPIFGVGPGLALDFMNSTLVPSFLGEKGLTVAHNPHNLYINILTEYGLLGIGFILSIVIVIARIHRSIIKGSKRSTYRNQDLYRLTMLCSYMAIVGYLIYYLFQSVPLIYGIIFVLLRLALLSDRCVVKPSKAT